MDPASWAVCRRAACQHGQSYTRVEDHLCIGLVQDVVVADLPLNRAMAIAEKIAGCALHGLRATTLAGHIYLGQGEQAAKAADVVMSVMQ